MRIISGKYKGRQLQSAKDQSIRPTTNKIKEYIFELIGGFVNESVALDLFCCSFIDSPGNLIDIGSLVPGNVSLKKMMYRLVSSFQTGCDDQVKINVLVSVKKSF